MCVEGGMYCTVHVVEGKENLIMCYVFVVWVGVTISGGGKKVGQMWGNEEWDCWKKIQYSRP